jgi:hypothetical protein
MNTFDMEPKTALNVYKYQYCKRIMPSEWYEDLIELIVILVR